MARVPLNHVLTQVLGSGAIGIAPDKRLVLFRTGTLDGVPVYDAKVGGVEVDQPIAPDADGTFPGLWYDEWEDVSPAIQGDPINQVRNWRRKRTKHLFYPEDYGVKPDGTVSDATDMQDCWDDARDHGGTVELAWGADYVFNDAPRTDRGGNCILSILDEYGSYKPFEIRSGGPPAQIAGYEETEPAGVPKIRTERTSDAYSGTFGPPSLIGGGTEEQGWDYDGGPTGATNAIGVVTLKGFWVVTPENPNIGALDMLTFGGCDATDVQAVAGDGGTAAAVPTNEQAFGIRWPARWTASRNFNLRCGAHQFYAGHVYRHPDHHVCINGWVYKCNVAYAYESAGEALQGVYGMHLAYAMHGATPYGIAGWDPVNGVQTIEQKQFLHRSTLQLENGVAPFSLVQAIWDDDNELEGDLQIHYFGGLAVDDNLPLIGAQNLRLELSRQTVVGGTTTVASASTLEVPAYMKVAVVTGSTQINNLHASWVGREVLIVGAAGANFVVSNSGNINLPANETITAGASLKLQWDGTEWQPVGGSVLI